MEKGIQEAIFLKEDLGTTGVQIDDVGTRFVTAAAEENQAALQLIRQRVAEMKAVKAE
ncbi:MAG: hypothetical protein ABIE14_02780 [Patescibacteria group bacterium]